MILPAFICVGLFVGICEGFRDKNITPITVAAEEHIYDCCCEE